MTLEIKSYDSTDVEVSWWTPELHEDVYFPVTVRVGEVGSEAGDNFEVMITTPEALRKHAPGDVLSTRATLVLADYSPQLLRSTLERIVRRCSAHTWSESVLKLQRYFRWEYEDYRGP